MSEDENYHIQKGSALGMATEEWVTETQARELAREYGANPNEIEREIAELAGDEAAAGQTTDRESLTDDERRALAHIRGRTTMGKLATGLYEWSDERWAGAIDGLTAAGYPVQQVHGTVADDPTVTGGWVFRDAVDGGVDPPERNPEHTEVALATEESVPEELARGGDPILAAKTEAWMAAEAAATERWLTAEQPHPRGALAAAAAAEDPPHDPSLVAKTEEWMAAEAARMEQWLTANAPDEHAYSPQECAAHADNAPDADADADTRPEETGDSTNEYSGDVDFGESPGKARAADAVAGAHQAVADTQRLHAQRAEQGPAAHWPAADDHAGAVGDEVELGSQDEALPPT